MTTFVSPEDDPNRSCVPLFILFFFFSRKQFRVVFLQFLTRPNVSTHRRICTRRAVSNYYHASYCTYEYKHNMVLLILFYYNKVYINLIIYYTYLGRHTGTCNIRSGHGIEIETTLSAAVSIVTNLHTAAHAPAS